MNKHFLISLFVVRCLLFSAQTGPEDISGAWLLKLQHDDIGVVNTVMYFKSKDSTFEAHTRENADRAILSWSASKMVRAFSNGFKNGSLLRIVNGIQETVSDTTRLSGVLVSALGNFYFKGYAFGNTLDAQLTNRKGEQRGLINGKKETPKVPLENYPELFKSVLALTQQRIYNRDVLSTKKWKRFEKTMNAISSRVQDDLEMVFAFFYRAGKLPFSHYALTKIPNQENNGVSVGRFVTLEEKSPGTAYMKISSFSGSAREMDSVFVVINSNGYKNLIVDLRNNAGGSVEAGMAFANNVFDSVFYGGIFLTQKWFNAHKTPPAVNSYSAFPHFSEANFDLIIEGIHNTEGLCLKIVPKKEVYKGRLFVLINNNTASTCEPLVYGLKQLKRATLVGERSAGAMLNGEVLAVEKGFKLVVPTADYYASDGYHIDQQGVKPDIPTPSAEALKRALKVISGQAR